MTDRKIPVIYQQKRKLINVDLSSIESLRNAISRRLKIANDIQLFGKVSEHGEYFDIEDDEDLEELKDMDGLILLAQNASASSTSKVGFQHEPHLHADSPDQGKYYQPPTAGGLPGAPGPARPYPPDHGDYPPPPPVGLPVGPGPAQPLSERPPEYTESMASRDSCDSGQGYRGDQASKPSTSSKGADQPTSIFNGATNFIFTEFDKSSGKHVPGLNEMALKELNQMREKLIVVSVVGAYRTGKSFLLSRLLKEAKSEVKFEVGHKSEPMTQGLWLMVVDHPVRTGYKLALIDTEGIGDTDKGDTQHDTTLFVLTCLLSHTLIYNGKTAIDENAFEKLGAEMSKFMISKKEGEDDTFHEYFPDLVYVVRDFSLQLESKGRKITSDEYLENALKVRERDDPEAPRSKVRKCIKKYFSKRRCFTLDIPAASRKILNQMDAVDDEKLNEDFVKGMNCLCAYIMVGRQSRALQNDREINGHQLAVLIGAYVNAYRDGTVPNVGSAMESLKTQENRKVKEQVIWHYDNAMAEYQQQQIMPTDTPEEVIAQHVMVQKKLLVDAQKEAILDDNEIDEFVRDIEAELDKKKKKFVQENERLSTEACEAALKRLYAPLATKRGTTYNKPGGYNEYRVDVIDVERAYQACERLGVMKHQMWIEFAKNEKEEEISIMKKDEQLCEDEKEVARIAQRQAIELAALERENIELKNKNAEREAKEAEARLKESETLKEKMKKQNEDEKKARVKMEDAMLEMTKQFKRYHEDQGEYKKLIAAYKEKEKSSGVLNFLSGGAEALGSAARSAVDGIGSTVGGIGSAAGSAVGSMKDTIGSWF